MTDFVLVPGAFHGGWCWRQVADALLGAGHRVATPTLTGLADRRHLLAADVDLDTHIDDIVNTIRYAEMDDLVLVCHSFGGVPGVGAADRLAERIRALVLLDALLPVDGLSSSEVRERSGSAWSMELVGRVAVDPPSSTLFGIPSEECGRIDALLTPHPVGTLVSPIALTGAYETIGTKRYHRFLRYAAPYMDDSADRATAAGWHVERHDLGHDAMLVAPDWTATALLEAERVSRSD